MNRLDKADIISAGLEHVERKISELKAQLEELSEAIASDTKSSAGDKYETSRAMIHQEQEKLHRQLNSQLDMKVSISRIPVSLTDVAEVGSLVVTDKGLFFISCGLGQVILGDERIFFISPGAPLALQLKGKIKGEFSQFNGQRYSICDLY